MPPIRSPFRRKPDVGLRATKLPNNVHTADLVRQATPEVCSGDYSRETRPTEVTRSFGLRPDNFPIAENPDKAWHSTQKRVFREIFQLDQLCWEKPLKAVTLHDLRYDLVVASITVSHNYEARATFRPRCGQCLEAGIVP